MRHPRPPINGATDYTRAGAATVVKNRLDEGDSVRRAPGAPNSSLTVVPPVVASFDNQINLLAAILADVATVEVAGEPLRLEECGLLDAGAGLVGQDFELQPCRAWELHLRAESQ